ncbi:hypothetical protein [Cohnella sp. JJ-181]|uniref:hypothetical protein n=1 Tax=Cohnella rhizoplanae TaxID=2974897 RepID=UPI0022FF7946|nr:hypothetical protein [Cohnella sp. JJ-181]CAI6080467.1 hypothetical protein COHCIP112018_02994 [Cohnella sp. JJ-181]
MSANEELQDQEVLEAHTEELGEETSAENTGIVAVDEEADEAEVEAAPAVEDAVLADDWVASDEAPAAQSIETEEDADTEAAAQADDDADEDEQDAPQAELADEEDAD